MSDERKGLPSASEMKQIMECDGYLALKAHLVATDQLDKESNEAADRGTRMHEMIRRMTLGIEQEDGIDPDEFRDAEVLYQRAMGLAQKHFNMDNPEGLEILAEERIFYKAFLDDAFSGQKDLAIIDRKAEKVLIIDYKTGTSPVDDPQDWNWQLMALAVLVRQKYDIPSSFTYHMAIIQVMNPTKVGTFSSQQVWDSTGQIMDKLERPADNPFVHSYNPSGSRCKYCSCRHNCPALSYQKEGLIASHVAISTALPSLTGADLAKLLDTFGQLKNLEEKLREEVLFRLNRGGEIPGYKLKEVAGRKSVEDSSTVAERLIQAGVPPLEIQKMVKLSMASITKLAGDLTGLKGKKLVEFCEALTDGCMKQGEPYSTLTNA